MRARILSLLCLLCASMLVLTSCSNITPPNPPAQLGGATYIYAATYTATPGTILSIPTAYSGTITATTTTTGSSGTIFKDVCTDGAGKLYAVQYTGTPTTAAPTSLSVYVYTIPNLGTGSTTGVIGTSRNFPLTLTSALVSMAADPIGNVYISQQNGTLTEYPATATSGTTNTPSLTLSLSSFVSMTTDASANLFAATAGGTVYEFLSGFTTSTPAKTFTISATTANVLSLAVDPSDNVYILGTAVSASAYSVFEFPAAGGTESPTRTISGTATGFTTPSYIAVDKGYNIYVEDYSTTLANQNIFLEFPPSSNGNVAPASTITNSVTNTPTTNGIPYGFAAY